MAQPEFCERWPHETGDKKGTLRYVKEVEDELAIIKDTVEKGGELDWGLFLALKDAACAISEKRLAAEERLKKHPPEAKL